MAIPGRRDGTVADSGRPRESEALTVKGDRRQRRKNKVTQTQGGAMRNLKAVLVAIWLASKYGDTSRISS